MSNASATKGLEDRIQEAERLSSKRSTRIIDLEETVRDQVADVVRRTEEIKAEAARLAALEVGELERLKVSNEENKTKVSVAPLL